MASGGSSSAIKYWRPIAGIIVTVIILAALLYAGYRMDHRTPDSDPAAVGPTTSIDLEAGLPSGTQFDAKGDTIPRIVASRGRPQPVIDLVGDSYSSGTGATDPATQGYVTRLSSDLGWKMNTTTVSGGGYVNAGVNRNGPFQDTISRLNAAAEQPDAIVIQGGLNDKGLLSADVVPGVQKAIDNARKVSPNTPIIVVGLLWGKVGLMPDFVQKTYRDISRVALGARPVVFVNTFDLRFPLTSDGIHPTSEGHAIIEKWIADDLRRQGVVTSRAAA